MYTEKVCFLRVRYLSSKHAAKIIREILNDTCTAVAVAMRDYCVEQHGKGIEDPVLGCHVMHFL